MITHPFVFVSHRFKVWGNFRCWGLAWWCSCFFSFWLKFWWTLGLLLLRYVHKVWFYFSSSSSPTPPFFFQLLIYFWFAYLSLKDMGICCILGQGRKIWSYLCCGSSKRCIIIRWCTAGDFTTLRFLLWIHGNWICVFMKFKSYGARSDLRLLLSILSWNAFHLFGKIWIW